MKYDEVTRWNAYRNNVCLFNIFSIYRIRGTDEILWKCNY